MLDPRKGFKGQKRPQTAVVPAAPVLADKARTLYQSELQDEDEDEAPTMRRATVEQEYAAKLFNERKIRLDLMNRVSLLEAENAALRQEIANVRITRIKDETKFLEMANAKMFAEVGLFDGDQLQQTEQGLFVIPKSE